MHVRTPIMLGMIVLLVVVLSAFCYYRVSAPTPVITPSSTTPGF